MKIIEENLLKNTILQLNKYLEKHLFINDFYDNLPSLELGSLQSFSYKEDQDFFDKISTILNVVLSIIAHPHISNKGENVVLRSELVGNLTNEHFQKTIKDPSVWKEKNLEMVPEYVHYSQYTDELNIYENQFIRLLIDTIDKEIKKYLDFYTSLIPSLENKMQIEIIENNDVEKALTRIEQLNRKLSYILNTYFYKELSKEKHISKQIKPTNILLKDRLYNRCFRFYREFIKYEDFNQLLSDFREYYYYVILKEFKTRGFELLKQDNDKNNNHKSIYNLRFSYKDYIIYLGINNQYGIYLDICLENCPNQLYRHELYLDTSREVTSNIVSNPSAISTHIVTIWNLIDQATLKEQFINPTSEANIIKLWLDSLMHESIAKKSIYTKYCPNCKSNNLKENNGIYKCMKCNSIYTFKTGKGKDIIWFINLRR